MPITFYGKWSLAVIKSVAPPAIQQRVLIAGSNASDGPVPGIVGQQVAEIDGASWEAYLESSNDGAATWVEFPGTQRVPSVTPQDGLIVTLSAGLVAPLTTEILLIVQFNYLNPQVNPPGVYPPPFCFTLPAGSFYPQGTSSKEPDCCCCCSSHRCSCRHRKASYGRQTS